VIKIRQQRFKITFYEGVGRQYAVIFPGVFAYSFQFMLGAVTTQKTLIQKNIYLSELTTGRWHFYTFHQLIAVDQTDAALTKNQLSFVGQNMRLARKNTPQSMFSHKLFMSPLLLVDTGIEQVV
jgi:hypothetical protein